MSRKTKDKPKGQVMILVAMLAMTFIFFFKFVVDTGVLIVAKINIQNAADLAAYSGAASQARLLNQIGFLNYNMRKAYKKFLFEYYVVGTSGQESFPTTEQMGPRKYQPNSNNPLVDYKVPVVCIDYENMTDASTKSGGFAANNCRVTAKKKLQEVKFTMGGAMGDIYNTFVKNMNAQSKNNYCPLFAANNMLTLVGWLYNADPAHKAINDDIAAIRAEMKKNPQKDNPLQQAIDIWEMMKAVMPGVGLIPRLYIDQMRIQTLTEYLNKTPYSTGVTINEMATLGNAKDPAENERTIEAFYSAYNTLGSYLFDSNSIKLEELQPGNEKTPYANFLPIKTSFSAYFLDTDDPDNDGSCVMVPRAMDVKDLVIGVAKDPAVQTYYAVRLKATANMIYWPTKSFQLKAYAAARPFGGYTGPDQEKSNLLNFQLSAKLCPIGGGLNQFFTMSGNTPSKACDASVQQVANTMLTPSPDMLGYNEMFIQSKLFEKISDGGSPPKISPQKIMLGVDYAEIPNPAEKNLFLIANDVNDGKGNNSVLVDSERHTHEDHGDPFNHYFHRPKIPDPNGAQLFIHHFWAPIISPSNSNAIDMAKTELKNKLKAALTPKQAFGGVMKDRVEQVTGVLTDAIEEYIGGKLYGGGVDSGQGDLHESLNIAAIADPLKPAHAPTLRNDPDWIPVENPRWFMTDAARLRTSWVTNKDDHIFSEGRVGYSVKIVRLKELTGRSADPKSSGDGKGTTATNFLTPDPEMQGDGSFDYLEH